MLEAVGLSADEVAMYQALVTRPGAGATELAEACGLTPTDAEAVLRRLLRTGLTVAASTEGDGEGFEAVAPESALDALISRQERRLTEARSELARLGRLFRDAGTATDPGLVRMISGAAAISQHVNRLHASARDRVRSFDRPPYIQRPGENLPRQRRRQLDGVAYRTIYSHDALAWPGRFREDILASCESGEQARVRADLPAKLLIVDEDAAVMSVAADDAVAQTAFVIHSSSLLAVLIALFEHEWSRAVPLVAAANDASQDAVPTAGAAGAGQGPDEQTRALLCLLAGGLTDETVARTLGWSARTTQRRISALMRELGVSTRFQAGAAARDRGWL
jgi:DNA-binding CsgD family transcriptional regulator/predicted DNA-binding transcriptional regulator